MMKNVQLNLSERLMIIEILPREGNIISLRLVHDLKQKLSPSQEEIKEWEISVVKDKENQIQFSEKANQGRKKLSFFPAEIELIRKQLTDLSNQNKLPVDILGVYDIFFNNPESKDDTTA